MIDVKKVAGVARLNLTKAETKKFSKEVKDILKMFSELDKVNVSGVEPSFHVIKTFNVVREDRVEKSLTNKEALANTEHKEKGFFKGPKSV
ncbi:MAG: Asp-tRNA(Asn)/Glu-tRNA(Gln) amidotransferase subunit GatC [Nanoarchaeota archaeon]|nr:Asp-tRNA(Asn)/Glu-tRNA(Gln) amidotransferase subunit GatC [Nanoarchaeota archaeon]